MTNTVRRRERKRKKKRQPVVSNRITNFFGELHSFFFLPYSQFCIGSHRINETNNDDQRKNNPRAQHKSHL